MKLKLSRRQFIFSTILIFFCFLMFGAYEIDKIDYRPIVAEIIISFFLVLLSLIPFLYNWYKMGRPTLLDWFRLSTFISLIYSYFKLIDKFNEKIEWVYGREYFNQSSILSALIIILVGLTTLFITETFFKFILAKRKKKKTFSNTHYFFRNKSLFYIFSFCILGVQAYLLISGKIGYGAQTQEATGSFSFLQQIFLSLSTFILSALAIFKFSVNTKSKSLNFIFYLYLVVQITLSLLSGMKGNVIYTFITVLIPYLISGRLIPKKYFLIAILPALLLYPLMDNYREILFYAPNVSKDKVFALAIAKTLEVDFSSNIVSGSEKYSSRMEMFPVLLYSVDMEPEWTEYKNMTRYIYLPVSILPRFIIPSKPIANTGEVLNYKISGYKGNSQTPTTYGWAYFEGGYFFVVIAFFLLAFFVSLLDFKVGHYNLFGLLIYINLIITLFVVEHDIYFLLSKIFQNLVVYYVFYKILFKNVKKPQPSIYEK